jgi:4-amino-4-deoxy-L-arabinose transferase-like glycosyltransferase
MNESESRLPNGKLLALLVALYLFIAGSMAIQPHGLWPDEALYMGVTKNFLAGKGMVLGEEKGIFPVLPLVSSLMTFFTGGISKLPFYLATMLAGVAAIIGTYFLVRKVVRSGFYALFAAVLLAANHLFLFYSTRILLDVYDTAVIVWGLFAILRWLEEPSSISRSAVAGALIALAYFVRVPNALVLGAVLASAGALALLTRKKLAIIPIALLAVIPTFSVGVWSLMTGTGPLGIYAGTNQDILGNTMLSNIPIVFQSILFSLNGWIALLLVIAGVLTLVRSPFAIPLAIAFLTVNLSRMAGANYDARYFLSAMPLCFLLLVSSLKWIAEKIPIKREMLVKIALPSLAILLLAAPTLSAGFAMFDGKKGGYLEIEYSGDWLRKNTPTNEAVFSGAHRIVALTSDRKTLPIPANESELLARLAAGEARYVEIDNYDWAQPQYALSLPQNYPANFTVAKEFFNQQTGGGSAVLKYVG